MPFAAADSGSSASETSIQAQTFPSPVILVIKESASAVRPEHSGPTTSVIAPAGRPPCNNSSTVVMPVGATARTIRGAGVSADGIRFESADSILTRSVPALNMFALYSPTTAVLCQLSHALKMVQYMKNEQDTLWGQPTSNASENPAERGPAKKPLGKNL